jgi:hypothetical protein
MIVELDEKTRGVLRQAMGEAIGGFAARSFPAEGRAEAEALRLRLESEAPVILADDEIHFALRALQFALNELGPEEFQTITGYDFDFGVATAKSFQSKVTAADCESEI